MPSLASLSMRGVGVMPPYTPKSPQPTLSSRTNTMFGLSPDAAMGCCACATWTGFTDAATDAAAKAVATRSTLRRLGAPLVSLASLAVMTLSSHVRAQVAIADVIGQDYDNIWFLLLLSKCWHA